MRLIPLGSGGWIPTAKRSTSCFLVEVEDRLIILDAGTGLHKLGNYLDILDKYEHVDIMLSHYHLDHIIGLSYLPKWTKEKILTIWGPGKKYYKRSCEKILTKFTSPPYFSEPIKNFGKEVYLKDYDEKGFMIGDLAVTITPQKHSNPSFAITLGNLLHFATDTNVVDDNFTKNCQLIIHECWSLTEEDAFGHSSLEELKKMVTKHKVTRLGLMHINPKFAEEDLKAFQDDKIFILPEDEVIIIKEK